MTRGRRLAAGIATVAVVLIAGRAAALLFSDSTWFAALGATSVWTDQVTSTATLYGVALVLGTAFAWFNMTAVRRSVVALIVPKRVGNVEFGEEIPSGRLRVVTLAMSVFIAAAGTLALPSWTVLAAWRSGITFGELDPYFQLDLSQYVAWLPLERAAYDWAVVLFATVSLLVVALYSLTPSLRWSRRGVRATTHARRHVTVLGTILLLLAAWSFRLAAFELLAHGSGPGGAFTRTDHVWLIPADVVLSVVTLGIALVLLAAGWMGQTGMALAAVTIVLAAALATRVAGPLVAAALAANPAAARAEAPYADIRDIYTARAFPPPGALPSALAAADSAVLATAGHLTVRGAALPPAVFPGAHGAGVEPDPARQLRAPRLGRGVTRVLNAWALQNPRLLSGDVPATAAILRRRDVRERISAIAPIFAQSRTVGTAPSATGIVWIVDLFATSGSYPLSRGEHVGARRITYSHHAGTAYVNGGTGAVVIVPDPTLDPIAGAWFAAHPGSYLASSLPAAFTAPPAGLPGPPAGAAAPDTAFRARVTAVYDRMRAALAAGHLEQFGAAFDSLGALVHPAPARR